MLFLSSVYAVTVCVRVYFCVYRERESAAFVCRKPNPAHFVYGAVAQIADDARICFPGREPTQPNCHNSTVSRKSLKQQSIHLFILLRD